MKDKLERLKQGEQIEVYDKNLVFALSQQINLILVCVQEESCFKVWVANETDQMQGYKKWCKDNKYNNKEYDKLQKYLKEAKIIWKKA